LTGLAELETRALASDEDRPSWLAVRRTGCTATDVRDLYLHKITIDRLVARKLGREPDPSEGARFGKAAAWGNQREPEIAEEVLARYGMQPEHRVFHAADNPRKLASPDGVGANFDGEIQVAEIKTHGEDIDIAPGSAEYRKKGYRAQKVWQMRVTGARRCLYATEVRLPDSTWYRPGAQEFYWLNWTDEGVAELAAELDRIAGDLLAALDKAASEPFDGPVIDEEVDTLAVNYLRGLDLEKEAKALKEPAYRDLFERLDAGESFVQESPLARVSFTPVTVEDQPVFAFDRDRAEAEAPEGLYAALTEAAMYLVRAQADHEAALEAVKAHEAKYRIQTGTERVVTKKASLRVTPGKAMKANG